jgi:hypothetical protein
MSPTVLSLGLQTWPELDMREGQRSMASSEMSTSHDRSRHFSETAPKFESEILRYDHETVQVPQEGKRFDCYNQHMFNT